MNIKGAQVEHRHIRLIYAAGISISLVLILLGLVLYAISPPVNDTAIEPGALAESLLEGNAAAVITFGLLVLLATPFAVAIALSISFIKEGDKRFALVPLLILILLMASIILGLSG
jgi:uncharacterized membrane protein